ELTGLPIPETALAILTIGALAAINCLGVKSGSMVQSVLMVLKIGVLLALILLGWLFHRPAPPPSLPVPADGWLAFGGAMVPVLFAYGGVASRRHPAPREPRSAPALAPRAGAAAVGCRGPPP